MAEEVNPQPGSQFTPGQQFQPQQQPVATALVPAETSNAPYLPPAEVSVEPIQTAQDYSAPPEQPASPYQEPGSRYQASEDISWTASEYIAYEKSASWYIILTVVAVVLSVLLYFLTSRSIISAIVPIVGAMMFAIYGRRPPQELDYQVANGVLFVGPKDFPLDSFRSFSVVSEGAFSSILFMPLKRFAPPLSIYYSPEDQDAIVEYLSSFLPIEDHRQDMIERLMHRIRF